MPDFRLTITIQAHSARDARRLAGSICDRMPQMSAPPRPRANEPQTAWTSYATEARLYDGEAEVMEPRVWGTP